MAGLYTSAVSIARIPYSFFLALPAVMLPLISSAISQKNHGLVKKYITQSLRYVIMILLPIMALISAYADQIINLLYSIEFTSAGSILKILNF